MIEIAEGDARDIAAIMPVMQKAFDPEYGESWTAAQCISTLSIPNTRLVMARRNKTAVGFAISRWVLDQEELLMIGVSPDIQGAGIGRSIIGEVVRNLKKAHREILFLEVRDGNPAYFFYQKMGFTVSGRRKNYYRGLTGAYHDAITMAYIF